MAANGLISQCSAHAAEPLPIEVIERRQDKLDQAPAVLGTILQELKGQGGGSDC